MANKNVEFGTDGQKIFLVWIHIIVSLIQIIHQFNLYTIPVVNQVLWVVSFIVIAAVIIMIIKNPLELDLSLIHI